MSDRVLPWALVLFFASLVALMVWDLWPSPDDLVVSAPPREAVEAAGEQATEDHFYGEIHKVVFFADQQARIDAEAERVRRAVVAEQKRREAARRAQEARTSTRTTVGAPVVSDDVWARLSRCESGMNRYAVSDTNPPYYSYFQWSLSTWRQAGGSGHPFDASYEEQRRIAQAWLAKTSWAQWPKCSRVIGVR